MSKENGQFRHIGKVLLGAVTNNWGYKLIALLAAILLWAGLISQDNTLTREKVFTDVSVSVIGAESAIQNNGLIVVSGLDEEALTVRMWVDVPQGQYKNVSASTYNPRVDLTKIKSAGEQTLQILTTSSSTNGTVSQITPNTVQVVVDEYVTNYRVPVTINVIGEYPEGMSGGTPVGDPSTVAVSGPKTVVDRIARLCVDYDLSMLKDKTGTLRTAVLYRFEDASGNAVESDNLKVTNANLVLRTITVAHNVYYIQEVPVSDDCLITGTPASGYAITGVELFPSSVTIGGTKDAITAIEQIFAENPVDVDGASESFTKTVRLSKPSELTSLSSDTVKISVNIAPVEISREFTGIKLNAKGLGSTLKTGDLPKAISLTMTGAQNELSKVKSSQISAYVDCSALTEPGSYTLPISIQIQNGNITDLGFTCEPQEVLITIQAK